MTLVPSSSVSALSPETANLNVPIIHAITNHLEFLGYEVAIQNRMCRATHPRKFSFSFYRTQADLVKFMMFFDSKEYAKAMKEEFYRFINMLNDEAFVSYFSLNDDFSVISNLAYVGEYNKITFARIIELWEIDALRLFKYKESSDFV